MQGSVNKPGRFVKVAAAIAAVALVVTACGSSDDKASDDAGSNDVVTDDAGSSDDSADNAAGIDLISDGVLTVCTHLPYKPFEFNDAGKVVGFDVDIAGLLADQLDAEVSVIDIDWSQITSGAAFAAKKCEVGFGAATITPERQESVLFSDSYFDANQALLVRSDEPYATLADLEGKKVGAQIDTTGQFYAQEHEDEFGYTIVVFEDSLAQFNAVLTGAVDAAINDNAPEYNFAQANEGVEVATEFETGEHYGFMFEKDSDKGTQLAETLNKALADAFDDGTYDKLFEKWFGMAPAASDK